MQLLCKDENQLKAINHGEGPALVMAGPGSGKTYVITNRILNLLHHGVSPNKILVITFTKRAAAEMRKRFLILSDNKGTDVVFGTFHSVYLGFLKYFNSKTVPQIISNIKQKELVNNIIQSSKLLSQNVYFQADNADNILSAISFYKSTGNQYPSEYPPDLFDCFIKQYEECISAAGMMDYDDILLKCLELLNERQDYCNILKNKYDYILIDEFQDISRIQYDILKLIGNDRNNVFIVGDDDQSIYGFRGASPKVMSSFLSDYPNTQVYNLNINYRCKKNIVLGADRVIAHNLVRLNREPHISFDSTELGTFEILKFTSKEEQYLKIKEQYHNELNNGKSVAVLVRTNKDIYTIKEFFDRSILIGGNDCISDNLKCEIYSDIRAYIHFTIKHDRRSFLHIIRCPNIYISREICTENIVNLSNLISRNQGTFKGNNLSVLKRHIDILQKSSPFAFVMYLLNIVGYKDYIINKYSLQKEEINMIMDELLIFGKKAKNIDELYHLIEIKKENSTDAKPQFNILTFHSAKGLEFDTVIIPDVNEGRIPGRASVKSDDTEEERRLFYVAMTRARSHLIITCIKGEDSMRVLPSRFITEFL